VVIQRLAHVSINEGVTLRCVSFLLSWHAEVIASLR